MICRETVLDPEFTLQLQQPEMNNKSSTRGERFPAIQPNDGIYDAEGHRNHEHFFFSIRFNRVNLNSRQYAGIFDRRIYVAAQLMQYR